MAGARPCYVLLWAKFGASPFYRKYKEQRMESGILKPTTINCNVFNVFPSFAMLAGMQLDVFTPLKDGPMDAKKLAGTLDVREDKLSPLLYLLVVAGLLQVENGVFANTEESAKFLVRGRPEYMGESSGFYKLLWELALKTGESIRTGKPQAKLDFHNLPDDQLLDYFSKQVHHSLSGGNEIAEKIDFSKFKMLLDAGGGTGGVSISICSKYPHLKATVADLPKVVKVAEHFIAENNMADRIGVSATDLCQDYPAGMYDVAILRAVIQTLSQEEAEATLHNVSRSMLPGGQIYIFGNVLKADRLGPPISLAYSLVFLNSYDNGQAYTENEYREMLEKAGFAGISVDYEFLDGMCLVQAQKMS